MQPPYPFLLRGAGLTSNQVFKKGGLAGLQILEEVADKEGVTFFQGCCNFHIENKLKSVNLMTKKFIIRKNFSLS